MKMPAMSLVEAAESPEQFDMMMSRLVDLDIPAFALENPDPPDARVYAGNKKRLISTVIAHF